MRDCSNCKHHSDKGCSQWECSFEKIENAFKEAGYGLSEAYQHGFSEGTREASGKIINDVATELHKGLKKLKADDMLHAWVDDQLDKVRKKYEG